jgi:AcrR family transcriptional regulator
MRAVAKEVGVAAPSIYLHFADKAELVWAALADKYEQLAQWMHEADEQAAANGGRERLRAQIHAYCRFAQQNPGHYRLMYEIRQPTVNPARMGYHPARRVSGSLRRALVRCAEEGYSLTLPLHQAAQTLWSGVHGIVSLQHSLAMETPATVTTGLADGLIDLVVSGAKNGGPAYPPTTEIDRSIAELVLDED